MYAIEKYAQPGQDDGRVVFIRSPIETARPAAEVDFACSHDVLEHVSDVPAAMRTVFSFLKPGGRFASSIDLRGHNAFNNPRRPLDFLSCPDWLWRLMFSHITTTNRVRAHEFLAAAAGAGFAVIQSEALARVDVNYLRQVKPHLLERYRSLADQELGILHLLLVLEKPG